MSIPSFRSAVYEFGTRRAHDSTADAPLRYVPLADGVPIPATGEWDSEDRAAWHAAELGDHLREWGRR